jgi:nitrogen fixation protein NifU and related proteins
MDDLYKDIILDHYRNPRNRGVVDSPDAATRGYNPLCGDELELSLKVEDGRVADVKSVGRGCSISLASASMMTDLVKGKPLDEAVALIGTFKGMLLEDRELEEQEYEALGDLEALEGLKSYPVRIKCALLAWNALSEVLGMVGSGEPAESRRRSA